MKYHAETIGPSAARRSFVGRAGDALQSITNINQANNNKFRTKTAVCSSYKYYFSSSF